MSEAEPLLSGDLKDYHYDLGSLEKALGLVLYASRLRLVGTASPGSPVDVVPLLPKFHASRGYYSCLQPLRPRTFAASRPGASDASRGTESPSSDSSSSESDSGESAGKVEIHEVGAVVRTCFVDPRGTAEPGEESQECKSQRLLWSIAALTPAGSHTIEVGPSVEVAERAHSAGCDAPPSLRVALVASESNGYINIAAAADASPAAAAWLRWAWLQDALAHLQSVPASTAKQVTLDAATRFGFTAHTLVPAAIPAAGSAAAAASGQPRGGAGEGAPGRLPLRCTLVLLPAEAAVLERLNRLCPSTARAPLVSPADHADPASGGEATQSVAAPCISGGWTGSGSAARVGEVGPIAVTLGPEAGQPVARLLIGPAARAHPPIALSPLGVFRSVFREKFGTPRQGALSPTSRGTLVLRRDLGGDALEGLDGFSHAWIIFHFHLNRHAPTAPAGPATGVAASGVAAAGVAAAGAPGPGIALERGNGEGPGEDEPLSADTTAALPAGGARYISRPVTKIKPPRLGGQRTGSLSTRSPVRFNPLGLTLARVECVDVAAGTAVFSGVDLVDGTPVIDVKPFHLADMLPAACVRVPEWVRDSFLAHQAALSAGTVVSTGAGINEAVAVDSMTAAGADPVDDSAAASSRSLVVSPPPLRVEVRSALAEGGDVVSRLRRLLLREALAERERKCCEREGQAPAATPAALRGRSCLAPSFPLALPQPAGSAVSVSTSSSPAGATTSADALVDLVEAVHAQADAVWACAREALSNDPRSLHSKSKRGGSAGEGEVMAIRVEGLAFTFTVRDVAAAGGAGGGSGGDVGYAAAAPVVRIEVTGIEPYDPEHADGDWGKGVDGGAAGVGGVPGRGGGQPRLRTREWLEQQTRAAQGT